MKNKSSWNFYAVKIIKQIIVKGKPDVSPDVSLKDLSYNESNKQTFEESIMLVRAQSTEHAYKIAEVKSRNLDEPYQNAYGQQVYWKFIKAVDCYLILDELKSGTEIYSCLHNTKENESAKKFIEKWFNPS